MDHDVAITFKVQFAWTRCNLFDETLETSENLRFPVENSVLLRILFFPQAEVEIFTVVLKASHGRALGLDKISADNPKCSFPVARNVLMFLGKQSFTLGEIPAFLKQARVMLLFNLGTRPAKKTICGFRSRQCWVKSWNALSAIESPYNESREKRHLLNSLVCECIKSKLMPWLKLWKKLGVTRISSTVACLWDRKKRYRAWITEKFCWA